MKRVRRTCPECPHCPLCKTTVQGQFTFDPVKRFVYVCKRHGIVDPSVNGRIVCVYDQSMRKHMVAEAKLVDALQLPKNKVQARLAVVVNTHLDGQGLQKQVCKACNEEIRYVPRLQRFMDTSSQVDCPKRGFRGHRPCNYYYACVTCGILTLPYDGRYDRHVCRDGEWRDALNITLGSRFIQVPVPQANIPDVRA